ncbi:MAG: HutD family protein [Myxococcota bacterium]
MRIARWADRAAQPWRNGGGITHELLREPADGDFALRVSVAEVAADGPFSRFPGVDRVILLLEGNGFRLTGAREVTIREVAAPFAFAGEDPWDCALLDGPVRDLNVMVDRARWAAQVTVEAGEVDLGPRGLVIALQPMPPLARWDVADAAGPVSLAAPAVVVRLRPRE